MPISGRDIISEGSKFGLKVQLKESTFNNATSMQICLCPIVMTQAGPRIQMHKVTEAQSKRGDPQYAPYGKYSPQVYIPLDNVEKVCSAILEAKKAILDGDPQALESWGIGQYKEDAPRHNAVPRENMPEF
jgi:hypothetical protein